MQGKYERIFSKSAVKKAEEAGLPATLLALHCPLMRGTPEGVSPFSFETIRFCLE